MNKSFPEIGPLDDPRDEELLNSKCIDREGYWFRRILQVGSYQANQEAARQDKERKESK